jgi:ferredoxin
MSEKVYKQLAMHLDALPQGYPETEDGAEIRLLKYLFTPEEAELAVELRLTIETPREIADRTGRDYKSLRKQLKQMARRGLIKMGRAESGMGFGALPFVVGIYEFQAGRIDGELAKLFEEYYQKSYGQMVSLEPQFHRVVPINQNIRNDMEVRPYESAADIVSQARSWGVTNCICRRQKALIGDPCDHPLEVCMVLSERPNAFDDSSTVRALTEAEAQETLRLAQNAGLVHSVSNSQEGHWYICNCCTCSCGILRGMADLGMSNVVAKSAFVNTVDTSLCMGCDICLDYCQFDALSIVEICQVDQMRCVGCGVCVPACPEGALVLVRRSEEEILPIPKTEVDWMKERAKARGQDISKVL